MPQDSYLEHPSKFHRFNHGKRFFPLKAFFLLSFRKKNLFLSLKVSVKDNGGNFPRCCHINGVVNGDEDDNNLEMNT
jgi:hypothetical protein